MHKIQSEVATLKSSKTQETSRCKISGIQALEMLVGRSYVTEIMNWISKYFYVIFLNIMVSDKTLVSAKCFKSASVGNNGLTQNCMTVYAWVLSQGLEYFCCNFFIQIENTV